jgi:hypothetical protein
MATFKKLLLMAAVLVSFHEAPNASSSFTGHVTYTLGKVASPTSDQSDAYVKITLAMDSAVWFYNTYTTITKKLTIEYNTSVTTADGNSNGNIRFGKDRAYMKGCTAMHEIAHTTGVGTTNQWSDLMKNGTFTGANATSKLREITNDPKAVVNGDAKAPYQHFWPYGLNYASEAKSKDDLIDHCLMVNAIQKDLFPTIALADAPLAARVDFSIALNSGNTFTYILPSPNTVIFGIYTISGKKVFSFDQMMMPAGSHSISINSQCLPQGFYVYRFLAGQHQASHSFVIGRK